METLPLEDDRRAEISPELNIVHHWSVLTQLCRFYEGPTCCGTVPRFPDSSANEDIQGASLRCPCRPT